MSFALSIQFTTGFNVSCRPSVEVTLVKIASVITARPVIIQRSNPNSSFCYNGTQLRPSWHRWTNGGFLSATDREKDKDGYTFQHRRPPLLGCGAVRL